MGVLNSRDRHKKHGVLLLRVSITRPQFTLPKSRLKCIGNYIITLTVPLLNAAKILPIQSVENFKNFQMLAIKSKQTKNLKFKK